MKKNLVVLLTLAIAFALCACGKSAEVKTIDRLIEEARQKVNPDESMLEEIYHLYSALPESDREEVDDIEYIMSIEKYLSVEAAIEKAANLVSEKKYEEAIAEIDSVSSYANAVQDKKIKEVLNTIYYPDTSFLRLENLLNYDENGMIVPWGDERKYTIGHDETLLTKGQVHHYSFARSNNSITEFPARDFENYLVKNYEWEYESLKWIGEAAEPNSEGMVYYDKDGNRLAYLISAYKDGMDYTVYIQYA